MSDIYQAQKEFAKACNSTSVAVWCRWSQAGGLWFSDCGLEWTFIEDGPKENGMNYCPKCGKVLLSEGGSENEES
ncbi:hypothetical protein [Pseudomonas phage vB_PaeM_RP7]|uniref:Uncharacterized protein n=1 Tax=Pseudomonas phage PAP-JP TaxID=2583508 RepID=A0A5C1K6L9_9CAUD|nr:hypothetical protein PAPJP_121 [Pseudomonas phage PAP-JP]UKH48019.1 MAG: hypothetical protein [Pseudomonas phage RP4]WAB56706.1 hypothetical protein [Pseudomonas phage vB_PaeM_RP15]WAB56992.1 hypothetical protein [Pseudomonas phage vB_PaeM_RP6]WAB57099.1 hypothetical protein [Pseudomonas phage vB_PaeM_RP7]WAB57236.1 hypothetical protein [Pseudomonas phage vB_PaeM_RP8]WAB57502.1 hypothetical protein [Pseudomonas phage vB_PaeM_RP9]WAB57619.1 hypothetical protein [Pseudomonas phage vB_PaeM_R